MVGDGVFRHKIDFFLNIFEEILNLESHPNRITAGSRVTVIYSDFVEWVDFAYWWIFSGGGSAMNGATPSSFNIVY